MLFANETIDGILNEIQANSITKEEFYFLRVLFTLIANERSNKEVNDIFKKYPGLLRKIREFRDTHQDVN